MVVATSAGGVRLAVSNSAVAAASAGWRSPRIRRVESCHGHTAIR